MKSLRKLYSFTMKSTNKSDPSVTRGSQKNKKKILKICLTNHDKGSAADYS